jgi:spore coat protein U-like protein
MSPLLPALIAALTVTVTAEAVTCSIQSVVGPSFGAYSVFNGTPLDTVGSVTYRCDDASASDTIMLQLSRGSSASYTPRAMMQGPYQLQYNLYLDASRTAIWGDGTSGTSQYGPVLLQDNAGTDVTVYVYGRIPAGQNARAGSYSDTVAVTVVF